MKLAQRAAALGLSALLLLPSAALAAKAPLSADAKRQDLDTLYDTLAERHPDLYANTPQSVFLEKKADIEGRLADMSDLEFTFALQSLTALAGDSHTTASLGMAEEMRFFPFALKWFDGRWYLGTVDAPHADGLGLEVTAMGGLSMDRVMERFASFVSADNPVKLRRQTLQLLYAADILEYLGLIQSGEPLVLTLRDGQGAESSLSLEAMDAGTFQNAELSSLSQRRTGSPATDFVKRNYLSLPLGSDTYYIQYNRCQEDPELPMETFAAQVAADLESGAYTQVLLDLRNNGGGSDGVLVPLLNLLSPMVRSGGLRLYGLIGETTFSSAIINAVMIQEMGGVLAGSPTSGSVNHFGSTGSFTLPNTGLRVSCSSKWIDLSTLLEAGRGYGVESLRPDVPVEATLADYLAGRDTVVDHLLAHGSEYQAPDRSGDALTRGYFLTLLYEAAKAGGKDVSAPENRFYDTLPFAYYAPAADWAARTGIAGGNGDGGLEPARLLTRAECAVMLVRFAAYMDLSLPAKAGPTAMGRTSPPGPARPPPPVCWRPWTGPSSPKGPSPAQREAPLSRGFSQGNSGVCCAPPGPAVPAGKVGTAETKTGAHAERRCAPRSGGTAPFVYAAAYTSCPLFQGAFRRTAVISHPFTDPASIPWTI